MAEGKPKTYEEQLEDIRVDYENQKNALRKQVVAFYLRQAKQLRESEKEKIDEDSLKELTNDEVRRKALEALQTAKAHRDEKEEQLKNFKKDTLDPSAQNLREKRAEKKKADHEVTKLKWRLRLLKARKFFSETGRKISNGVKGFFSRIKNKVLGTTAKPGEDIELEDRGKKKGFEEFEVEEKSEIDKQIEKCKENIEKAEGIAKEKGNELAAARKTHREHLETYKGYQSDLKKANQAVNKYQGIHDETNKKLAEFDQQAAQLAAKRDQALELLETDNQESVVTSGTKTGTIITENKPRALSNGEISASKTAADFNFSDNRLSDADKEAAANIIHNARLQTLQNYANSKGGEASGYKVEEKDGKFVVTKNGKPLTLDEHKDMRQYYEANINKTAAQMSSGTGLKVEFKFSPAPKPAPQPGKKPTQQPDRQPAPYTPHQI